MTKLIHTKDSISRYPMTVRVSPRTGGIDVLTIYGTQHNVKQFDEAWKNEIVGYRLSNFIPLTRWGATQLRDALTKILETEV